jgi:hypothetical protein
MYELLQKISAFRGLEVPVLERIASISEKLILPGGACLFRSGEPADAFFVILTGSVQIKIEPLTGTAQSTKTLKAPALLGVQGMLLQAKRRASVITLEPCQFLKIDRSALKILTSDLPLLRARIQSLAPKPKSGLPNEIAGKTKIPLRKLNHRKYIGGYWDKIGLLQYNFLVTQGLLPAHCLLDIGCGSLRGGVHFIPYLEAGNYLGLDRNEALVKCGIEQELDAAIYAEKRPSFVISDCFEFHRFSKRPQFSIAQSLFTHLTALDVSLCLKNLRNFIEVGHLFFTTFYQGLSERNPKRSDSQKGFSYTIDEMENFGRMTGWKGTYIGNWGHPRHQMMMKYEPV